MTGPNAVSARGVHVAGTARPRLDDVSIDVPLGRIHALVGPNGSGKSTLLAVLAGDQRPSAGEVLVQGRPWNDLSARDAARARAILAQETPLAFPFTVREVVSWGRLPWRGMDSDDVGVIDAVVRENDLTDLLDRPVPSLSGGERARVHLARVMAQRAPLILLDEADAALDLAGQAHLDQAVRRRRDAGDAVVIVSHDLSRIASLADDVTLLDRGRVAAQGAAADMLTADHLSTVYGVPVREAGFAQQRHFWVDGSRD